MKKDPSLDPTSIGNLLKPFGVTDVHLAQAIQHMLASDARIGEALVDLGIVTHEQLDVALAQQKVLRAGKRPAYDEACRVVDYATERTKRSTDVASQVPIITARILGAGNA